MGAVDFDGLLSLAQRPERSATVCMDARLMSLHDDLVQQLGAAQQDDRAATTMLATASKAGREIAERIRELEEQMTTSSRVFRMRALTSPEKRAWELAHPRRKDTREAFNLETGPVALVAACCVAIYPAGEEPAAHPSSQTPVLTVEQVTQLADRLGHGQFDVLFAAAWDATNGGSSVPFSVAASETIRGSGTK